jgi:hypothetical protein
MMDCGKVVRERRLRHESSNDQVRSCKTSPLISNSRRVSTLEKALESCRLEQLQQSKQIQTAKKDHAERLAAASSENRQLLKQLDIQGKDISNQKLQIISLQDIADTEKARANIFCTLVGERQDVCRSARCRHSWSTRAKHGECRQVVAVNIDFSSLIPLLVVLSNFHVIVQNACQDQVFQTLQPYLKRSQLIARVQVGTGMTRRCGLALSPGLETKISTASNPSWHSPIWYHRV